MSVDKFGHYLNNTSSGILTTKNAPKLLGFFMDTDNNINVQNKRIKNVAKALEENDVINKLFLQSQIENSENKLIAQFKEDYYKMQENLSTLKSHFKAEVEKLIEKIYRIENYMFVTIPHTASNRLQQEQQQQQQSNN